MVLDNPGMNPNVGGRKAEGECMGRKEEGTETGGGGPGGGGGVGGKVGGATWADWVCMFVRGGGVRLRSML